MRERTCGMRGCHRGADPVARYAVFRAVVEVEGDGHGRADVGSGGQDVQSGARVGTASRAVRRRLDCSTQRRRLTQPPVPPTLVDGLAETCVSARLQIPLPPRAPFRVRLLHAQIPMRRSCASKPRNQRTLADAGGLTQKRVEPSELTQPYEYALRSGVGVEPTKPWVTRPDRF